MDSTALYEAFRSNVADTLEPYLWSDKDVWRYAGDAYRMFVRLTGGIPDFTSEATEVTITAGEATSELHPSILRIMSATLASNDLELVIINAADIGRTTSADYGLIRRLTLNSLSGPVQHMLIGAQKNLARWVLIPEANDTANLIVHRLPLVNITKEGQKLDEVEELHHTYLLDWMEHLAYLKKDAETFDKAASDAAAMRFRAYCDQVKSEAERYKHKTRIVAYGGL